MPIYVTFNLCSNNADGYWVKQQHSPLAVLINGKSKYMKNNLNKYKLRLHADIAVFIITAVVYIITMNNAINVSNDIESVTVGL